MKGLWSGLGEAVLRESVLDPAGTHRHCAEQRLVEPEILHDAFVTTAVAVSACRAAPPDMGPRPVMARSAASEQGGPAIKSHPGEVVGIVVEGANLDHTASIAEGVAA